MTLGADELAEIKKLPADEQAVALKQIVCPVSGEHLGSMGVPLKVTAEGKTFSLLQGLQEGREGRPEGRGRQAQSVR